METATLYLFVIDTETYAGNIVRELAAWCTGQLDDMALTGWAEADAMTTAFPAMAAYFAIAVLFCPTSLGWDGVSDLVATPGYWEDGAGHNARLDQWDGHQRRWPAYQSVGIFFQERPSPDAQQFMMQRARSFRYDGSALALLGFRLLRRETHEVLEAGYPADYGTPTAEQ